MSIKFDPVYSEDDIRDLLAICDLPHTDWQVKILTDLLNSRGKVTTVVCRHSGRSITWTEE